MSKTEKKERWEEQMDEAVEMALKVSRGVGRVGKEYSLIAFEAVLRKLLNIKFP